jgi:hypothetical protein
MRNDGVGPDDIDVVQKILDTNACSMWDTRRKPTPPSEMTGAPLVKAFFTLASLV